jgi:hypothetical protein
MKRLLKYLNPIRYVRSIRDLIKEIRFLNGYVKRVKALDKSGVFKKQHIRVNWINQMYVGVDLQSETLMYDEGPLDKFERMLVAQHMSKYNDFLMREGLLEFLRTDLDRIKTEDQYGYIVWMKFNYKNFTLRKLLYVILYTVGASWLLHYIISGNMMSHLGALKDLIINLF